MKSSSLALLCSLSFTLATGVLQALDTGELNTSFGAKIFTGGAVQVTASSADGKQLYVGGGFDWINGQPADWLARLNADGNVDPAFNPVRPANEDQLLAIAPQADGKVLVGYTTSIRVMPMGTLGGLYIPPPAGTGNFPSYYYPSSACIARLNADGSADSSFTAVSLETSVTGGSRTGVLSFILPYASGKILVGGNFTTLNGNSISNLACLNADGSVDTTFKTTVDGAVETALLTADGSTVIGGQFSHINKSRLGFGLARLKRDGKRDTAFVPRGNPRATHVARIAAGPGKELLVATVLTLIKDSSQQGQPKSFLEVVEATGRVKRTAVANVMGWPLALAQYDSGTAVLVTVTEVLGTGTTVTPVAPAFAAFAQVAAGNVAPQVATLGYKPGGIFHTASGWTAYGLSGPGTTATPSMTGFEAVAPPGQTPAQPAFWIGHSATVDHIAASPGSKLLVSGSFTFGITAGGLLVERQGLARLDGNGNLDEGFTPAAMTVVKMLANADGGATLIGNFVSAPAAGWQSVVSSGNSLIQLTGTGAVDPAFTLSDGAHEPVLNYVNVLTRQQDGKLLVGGTAYAIPTTNSISTPAPGTLLYAPVLKRMLTDGTEDTAFAPTFSNSTKNSWGWVATAGVTDIQIDWDGALLISGTFDTVDGIARSNVVRLLTDGSVDATNLSIAPPGGFSQVMPRNGGYLITAPQLQTVATGTVGPTSVGPTSAGSVVRTISSKSRLSTIAQGYLAPANPLDVSSLLQKLAPPATATPNPGHSSSATIGGFAAARALLFTAGSTAGTSIIEIGSSGSITGSGSVFSGAFSSVFSSLIVDASSSMVNFSGLTIDASASISMGTFSSAVFTAGSVSNLAIAILLPPHRGGDGLNPFLGTDATGATDTTFSVADLVLAPAGGWHGNTYGVKFATPLPGGGWVAMTYGLKDNTTSQVVSLIVIRADGSIDRTYSAPTFGSNPAGNSYGFIWGWAPQVPADFVSDLIVLDDGSIVMAGTFWSVNGEARNGLVKLLPVPAKAP